MQDPCEIANNLACDTQDFDMDGVPNGEDEAPEDICVPNMPDFEVFVVGTWVYSLLGVPGEIIINADGTYEDINGLNASLNLVANSAECDMIDFSIPGVPNFIFTRK